jgi:hypothetical protein
MIEPESFSESHQAFKYFRKVTDPAHFLRWQQIVPPRWSYVLCLSALPVTIWIAHFLVTGPFAVFVLAFPNPFSLLMSYVYFGTLGWIIVFCVPYIWFKFRWIKRVLKDKRITVKGWNWFGPEVQLLILQQFAEHLRDKGLLNPEALNQLIDNSRDVIEARWRPMPVLLTLITLGVALVIACFQPLLSQLLVVLHTSIEDITTLAKLAVLYFVIVFVYGYMSYSHFFSPFRRERAIYMHCLSDIRLGLLKSHRGNESNLRSLIEVRIYLKA